MGPVDAGAPSDAIATLLTNCVAFSWGAPGTIDRYYHQIIIQKLVAVSL